MTVGEGRWAVFVGPSQLWCNLNMQSHGFGISISEKVLLPRHGVVSPGARGLAQVLSILSIPCWSGVSSRICHHVSRGTGLSSSEEKTRTGRMSPGVGEVHTVTFVACEE